MKMSLSGITKRPNDRERSSLRRRVGVFVRKRREELGLSQGDVIRALGYVSRNSVSNIETGREGLPAKRIYAWADLLRVPHDAFYRFATGETRRMVDAGEHPPASNGNGNGHSNGNGHGHTNGHTNGNGSLSAAELELLEAYRSLPSRLQRQLRTQAREFSASLSLSPR